MIFGTHLTTLNIGLMMYGRARWQEAVATIKYFNTVLTRLRNHKGGSLKSFTLTIPWNLAKPSWNHCTSTPHRSETNGIAERAVRRVKEGTSAVLLQSGLDEKLWADSMECFSYLRNIQDLLSALKTPFERRFGKPFKGPIVPFGSLVEYHPITAKDSQELNGWPGGWGPQGMSETGGGGLARVSNLRVCRHPFVSGCHTQGEGRINVLPWYRPVGVAKTSSESQRRKWYGDDSPHLP